MIRTIFAAFITLFWANAVCATEYRLSAYHADPQAVAAAIGSGDKALEAKLLGMTEFVKEQGLEERFSDKTLWRAAVSDMVAGKIVTDEFMNGFAMTMLLNAVGEPSTPPSLDWPFADLDNCRDYLRARGHTELADLLHRISWGNTAPDAVGLPPVLKGKFGPTEYAARVSAMSPDDAKTLLGLLPQLEQANAELMAFRNGEAGAAAGAAKTAIEAAERKRWTEFFTSEYNKEYLANRTVEQAVSESIAKTLEDPYNYGDHLMELNAARPVIEGWLQHAIATSKAVFFVYESS